MTLLDVLSAPWVLPQAKLDEIRDVYLTHLRGEKIDIRKIEAQIGGPLSNEHPEVEVFNGVAVVSMHGVMAKRANLFTKVSGGVSTEIVGKELRAAANDNSVKAIILDVDSPGGEVDGIKGICRIIREIATVKPIHSFSDGSMTSGAQWVAASCINSWIESPTVYCGSVGVVTTHIDISEQEKRHGVKTTEISAGRLKRAASSYEPLSVDGKESIESVLNAIHKVFIEDISEFRGLDPLLVRHTIADGRLILGKESIQLGLVNGYKSLNQVIRDLADGVKSEPNFKQKEVIEMKNLTIEKLQKENPEVYEQAVKIGVASVAAMDGEKYAEGFETGKAEGVIEGRDNETSRIKAIEESAIAGHDELIAEMKFDGETSADAAAGKILKAEKVKRESISADIESDANQIDVPAADAPEHVETPVEKLPFADQVEAKWKASEKVRDEFRTFGVYKSFCEKKKAIIE